MPASLYRLAGKPHHTEPPVAVAETTTIVVSNEPEVPQVVESAPEVVESPNIVWDPTWTRSKLYQVAIDAGLSVDTTMTKTSIINVLSQSNMS